MSTKPVVTLEFSDSGRVLFIRHNGTTIAELLVHGPFAEVVKMLTEKGPSVKSGQPLPRVFRAEVYGLAGYEYLDKSEERIIEK